ncbi:HAD-IIIC family phosphatase [Spiractinospora alimapuensis]|uniref:HAD-IIIC family phosphatase n=1 Tax=Spiractinospora alimapuensis TaxID=2820884 RepID=UPI001F29A665|nr:HAD-IIIC family phosphatase [Spiractinospora alimapuensis]QVQ52479.1 HAD-IIIC family phosphatase [Spiractinospora alimapuensis]
MEEKAPERADTVKCLVWDLDNTLWKGTLLEDGETWVSEEIRSVVKELDRRGVLQAVASKNDHEPAWDRLEELGLAEYFVLPHIGWGPKSTSVKEIADSLNFALGTIAFIDDQPAERAEVEYHHAEVRTYTADQATSLVDLPEFTPPRVTVDATRRRAMYQASFQREAARTDHSGPDEDFLRSLELVMDIQRAGDEELSRVEELTARTSQMNATGVHYSDADLRALVDDPRHEVLVTTMADRFGPHGAVGVVLFERHVDVWHLKLLATSCRVVSFGAGAALLNWLVDSAARAGVHIVADFRPTDRNRMMEIAYRFAGFTDDDCACRSTVPWAELEEGDPLQRLHIVSERRDAPTTLRLTALDLAEG